MHNHKQSQKRSQQQSQQKSQQQSQNQSQKQNHKRWWITGTLTTAANLHLGSGESVADDTRVPIKNSEPAVIAAVITDANGKPWIPGASLRGALRQWAWAQRDRLFLGQNGSREMTSEQVEGILVDLFGRGGNGSEPNAGLVSIHGAEFVSASISEHLTTGTSHYQSQSHTLLEAGVAIDRTTGAASSGKLYYQVVVPPGVSFNLQIEARNVGKDHIKVLLAALDAFNRGEVTLGSETHSGKGAMQWKQARVACLEAQKLKAWIQDALKGKAGPPQKAADERFKDYGKEAIKLPVLVCANLDIALRFETLFCVNDPGRTAWAGAEKQRQDNPNQPELADKLPRLDAHGRALLPAKSFRGVLRSQMERIARTLEIEVCGTGKPCKPIHRKEDAAHLCPVCRLMGAPGWRSLVEIGDFVQIGNASEITQEFIAIDRFTGGGADNKKFNARGVLRPTLQGRIRLEEERMSQLPGVDPSLSLLALALRDLREGDLRFGLGAAKGYGSCKADISVALPADETAAPASRKVAAWLNNGQDAQPWPLAAKGLPASMAFPATDTQAVDGLLPQTGSAISPEPTKEPAEPDTFLNPYHFIPVPKPDLTQGWQPVEAFPGAHSHAAYASKDPGKPVYSGRIICRLTAETPFFIGAQRGEDATDQAPVEIQGFDLDGRPALPGSSLRGLISSLVEAATGSSLRVLDDSTLSYRKKVGEGLSAIGMLKASTVPGQFDLVPMTMPSMKAAVGKPFGLPDKWKPVFASAPLRESLPVYLDGYERTRDDQNKAIVQQKDNTFLKVRNPDAYSEEKQSYYYARLHGVDGVADADIPPGLGGLKVKHPEWGGQDYLLGQFHLGGPKGVLSEAEWLLLDGAEQAQYTRGILRVLGLGERDCRSRDMPTTKKHELFIPCSSRVPIPVSPEALERYCALGQEREKAKAPPYALKGYPGWQPRAGDLVQFDVEADPDGNVRVREISTSAIWRSRVEAEGKAANVHRFFAEISTELLPFNARRTQISPAELMFGFTTDTPRGSKDEDWTSWRGKVTPGFGLCVKQPERLEAVTLKILDTPKPPSPNLYFQVGGQGIKKSKLTIKKPPLGRKQYLHHDLGQADQPWKTQKTAKFKQHARIQPLGTGAEFLFHLDFENLSEWELSALCYALRPDDAFRHKLGMGKPLGLGSVRIDPEGLLLIDRKRRYGQPDITRYHQVWVHAGRVPEDWKTHYPAEDEVARELASPPSGIEAGETASNVAGAPDFLALRNAFRAGMNQDIRRAMDLLGNPGFVDVPVHYPLARNQDDMESEHYQWFVNNDQANRMQRLAPLNGTSSALPKLTRNTES